MTAAPDLSRLVVRGPDCLPAVVPHLLGFHPESSLVVLGLDPVSQHVRVTLRLDLDLLERPGSATEAELALPLLRAGASSAVLLVYPGAADDPWSGGRPGPLPHRALVDEVGAACDDGGVRALDALCVVGDRIGSYWCTDPVCCPAEGRLVPASDALAVDAAMAVHGSSPLPSRAALESALEPRPVGDPVLDVFRDERALLREEPPPGTAEVDGLLLGAGLWDGARRPAHLLAPLAALAAALCDRIVSRDLLLRVLTVDASPAHLAAVRALLVEAVRCLPAPERAPAASVLAVCAWISGDGASARVALERAAAADPAYSLAALVEAALDAGTPPWTWQSMMADLTVEAILEAAYDDDPGLPGDGAGWDDDLLLSDLLEADDPDDPDDLPGPGGHDGELPGGPVPPGAV